MKVLTWDHNGFVLYYKRLSKGRFRIPQIPAGAQRIELDATTLAMLLAGIDVKFVKRPMAWAPPAPSPTASGQSVEAPAQKLDQIDRLHDRIDTRPRT